MQESIIYMLGGLASAMAYFVTNATFVAGAAL